MTKAAAFLPFELSPIQEDVLQFIQHHPRGVTRHEVHIDCIVDDEPHAARVLHDLHCMGLIESCAGRYTSCSPRRRAAARSDAVLLPAPVRASKPTVSPSPGRVVPFVPRTAAQKTSYADRVRMIPGEFSSAEVVDRLGISINAACVLLHAMTRRGQVRRIRRDGKTWIYRAT